MTTGTLVSEEEYLHTSYEPDCEFEDGVLIGRNVGTPKHSELQIFLGAYFLRRRKEWNIHVYTELRCRIRTGKYMVPDIAVVQGKKPEGLTATEPPLIWIEILSPEDRPIRLERKIKQVLDYGAPYVWVIDPETLESNLHTAQGTLALEDGTLRIPGTEIVAPLADVFED